VRGTRPELGDQLFRLGGGRDDVFDLVAVEAHCVLTVIADFYPRRRSIFAGIGDLKQRARGPCDTGVGRLRDQNDGAERVKGLRMFQLTLRLRVALRKRLESLVDLRRVSRGSDEALS